ncbi:MAG: hypothetical protein Q7T36_08610 [Fluviicoccus sp.]|uniref:hypothetical protein n=1 Tax=Fluviicoccus sp. TaxID=2003552 RepID=UPI002715792C|nr:hypothetical protein [Fluviicoccus sp.]MDO8330516.1 hypothetical protein [Fluviicoccus sp.]
MTYSKPRFLIPAALALAIAGTAHADRNDLDDLRTYDKDAWVMVKNDRRHQVVTYAKQEDDKRLRSFRQELTFDASIDAIALLLLDIENYPRWYHLNTESRILKKVSPTELYYYQVFDAPPGIPDRDVVVRATIQPYSARNGALKLVLRSAPDYMPPQPGLVRMPAFEMVATYTPLGNGQIKGVTEGYADPGGNSPAWAINYVQRAAPYRNALSIRRVVKEYENSSFVPPFKYKE